MLKNYTKESYNISILLKEVEKTSINRISFKSSKIIPNNLKRELCNYFVGRKANIATIALIKRIIDSW